MTIYPGCLTLLFLLALLLLVPFFFAHLMLAALLKLGLSASMAFVILAGIIFGSLVNIPVRQCLRGEDGRVEQFFLFGLDRWLPPPRYTQSYVTVAVNLGGCMIPSLLALYECARVARLGMGSLLILAIVTLVNIAVCYRIARPTPRIGLTMPALVPPLIAAAVSLLLIPDFAPPVAFVAGVLGPLIGADLLHLKEVVKIAPIMASIGGAGTFDGIVLSGLTAALLA